MKQTTDGKSEMNDHDLILRETARMDIYRALSACYYLPDRGLDDQLETLERQLAFIGSEALALAAMLRSELCNDESLETLQVEFARLFVGPYKLPAPPYGSIYLEGEHKVMGDSTVDAWRRYRESGLSIAETFKDAPDHIAAELEFMYFLVFNEIEALQSARADKSCEHIDRQKSFLAEHLGAWAGSFCAKVETAAGNDFYRYLGGVTSKFIDEDQKYLASLNLCAVR